MKRILLLMVLVLPAAPSAIAQAGKLGVQIYLDERVAKNLWSAITQRHDLDGNLRSSLLAALQQPYDPNRRQVLISVESRKVLEDWRKEFSGNPGRRISESILQDLCGQLTGALGLSSCLWCQCNIQIHLDKGLAKNLWSAITQKHELDGNLRSNLLTALQRPYDPNCLQTVDYPNCMQTGKSGSEFFIHLKTEKIRQDWLLVFSKTQIPSKYLQELCQKLTRVLEEDRVPWCEGYIVYDRE